MLAAIAYVFARHDQRRLRRRRGRRGRRLVPRLLHPRPRRGARPQGRRRHRLARRARRRDHRRASCSRPGASCPGRSSLLTATAWITVVQRVLSVAPAARRALATAPIALLCYHSPGWPSFAATCSCGCPPDLKRRLAAEVERRGASLNDVAVAILASRFGVPFEPSGRRGAPPRPAGDVLLRMPRELKDRLARRAARAPEVHPRPHRRDPLRGARPAAKGTHVRRTASGLRERQGDASATRCASRSSASATAPTRCSRASSTTRTRPTTSSSPGLMHVNLGGYHVRDIEFVAAFDVVKGKVGVDLAEAMWAHPNDTIKFADVAEDRRRRSRAA